MSSLFKSTFGSKNSKEFIELACKAMPRMTRDSAKSVYKSIKHGRNEQWSSTQTAMSALHEKIKLNIQIMTYQRIINDKSNSTFREIQSAKSHLAKLCLENEQTAQLLAELERGFGLERGALIPKFGTHLLPSSSRSHSRSATATVSKDTDREDTKKDEQDEHPSVIRKQSVSSRKHKMSDVDADDTDHDDDEQEDESTADEDDGDDDDDEQEESDSESEAAENVKPLRISLRSHRMRKESKTDKQRSKSVMMMYPGAGGHHRAARSISQSAMNNKATSTHSSDRERKQSGNIPSIHSKEYLQFLLEGAMTSKAWNDHDADRLCQCAVSRKSEWITVHSMWVALCRRLLLKHTIKRYRTELKLHRKSKRRGSKKAHAELSEFKEYKDESEIKSATQICVTIGYPLGQTSTLCKVTEAKQAVLDGATRIRLMVSAGKVVTEDWNYIIDEVKQVVGAANGIDVRIVFPDTPQISQDVKHTFNQKIMQGMMSNTPYDPNKSDSTPSTSTSTSTSTATSTSTPAARRKWKCSFSDDSENEDDEDDDDGEEEQEEGKKRQMLRPQSVRHRNVQTKSSTNLNGNEQEKKRRVQTGKAGKLRRGSTMQIEQKLKREDARKKQQLKKRKTESASANKRSSNDKTVRTKSRHNLAPLQSTHKAKSVNNSTARHRRQNGSDDESDNVKHRKTNVSAKNRRQAKTPTASRRGNGLSLSTSSKSDKNRRSASTHSFSKKQQKRNSKSAKKKNTHSKNAREAEEDMDVAVESPKSVSISSKSKSGIDVLMEMDESDETEAEVVATPKYKGNAYEQDERDEESDNDTSVDESTSNMLPMETTQLMQRSSLLDQSITEAADDAGSPVDTAIASKSCSALMSAAATNKKSASKKKKSKKRRQSKVGNEAHDEHESEKSGKKKKRKKKKTKKEKVSSPKRMNDDEEEESVNVNGNEMKSKKKKRNKKQNGKMLSHKFKTKLNEKPRAKSAGKLKTKTSVS